MVTSIRKAISFDLGLDKIFWQNRFCTFRTDLTDRVEWKQFFMQKCITNHTIKNASSELRTDSLQLQKREPIMWKHSRKSRNSSYIPLKLYSSIRSKTLLQRFCCSYYHSIDIISLWAGNSLQVYKDSNQVIPLKLQGMVFTVFTKENINNLMIQLNISMVQACLCFLCQEISRWWSYNTWQP